MATYNDLVKRLNDSYENSRDPHNYVDDLKKMKIATDTEKTVSLYDKIIQNNYWTFRGSWGDTEYKSVLDQELNSNILRIFKEIADPSEVQLLKCLVNLRGDYNQWADFLIKEAVNKKNLSSAETHAQEALSVKRKYDDAWKRLNNRPKESNGYYKVLVEVGSFLDKMNGYGYIHTKSEKGRISEHGLGKTEPITYVLYAICIIGFVALFIWLEPVWPWLIAFGFIFWLLGKF